MQRRSTGMVLAALAAILLAAPVAAQEGMPEMSPEEQAMMEAYMKAGTPGAPHEALAAMAGTYELAIKSWTDPAAPPSTAGGKAVRSMALDGRMMIEEVESSMMGIPFTGRGLTGYDNVTGKYWSFWMDSMSTGPMISHGTCDADQKCTYTGTWNDPIEKGPKTVRMAMHWPDPKTQVFEMFGEGPDGNEIKMMEITYTKK